MVLSHSGGKGSPEKSFLKGPLSSGATLTFHEKVASEEGKKLFFVTHGWSPSTEPPPRSLGSHAGRSRIAGHHPVYQFSRTLYCFGPHPTPTPTEKGPSRRVSGETVEEAPDVPDQVETPVTKATRHPSDRRPDQTGVWGRSRAIPSQEGRVRGESGWSRPADRTQQRTEGRRRPRAVHAVHPFLSLRDASLVRSVPASRRTFPLKGGPFPRDSSPGLPEGRV